MKRKFKFTSDGFSDLTIYRIEDETYLKGDDLSSLLGISLENINNLETIKIKEKKKEVVLFSNFSLDDLFKRSSILSPDLTRDYINECIKTFEEMVEFNFFELKNYKDVLLLLKSKEELRINNLLLTKEQVELDEVKKGFKEIFLNDVGKSLDSYYIYIPGFSMKRSQLYALLRKAKILDENNYPYQEFIDDNYFRVVSSSFENKTKKVKVTKVFVMSKGRKLIEKTIKTEFGKKGGE